MGEEPIISGLPCCSTGQTRIIDPLKVSSSWENELKVTRS